MARRYALVIGISEYQSPLKPLSKPATDAEAVATVLKQSGDFQEVTSLKETVTSPELIKALRTLLLEQATNNDVLIYFTGHGVPVVDPVIGKPKAYLATSDTIVTLEGKQVTEARRAVPLDSLNDLIQESQLSSLVMLFDSCHSGDFLERSLIEKTFTAFSAHKDYYLITACRGFEQAYAIKREQHSIFTGALLAGLSQANANEDGQVTGDRLFECIARELKGSGQEPIRMGYGGLITLVSYQPQPKVIEAIVDETGELICPYQGLQAFTAEQQAFFFGRQRTVEEIRRRLEERPLVPVIGASGSGKSSVVRAGLMPWLAETGWQILSPIKPGFDPLVALRAVFEPYFKRSKQEIQQLHQLIKSEPAPLPTLVARLSSAAANSTPEQADRFLLVVDQFEEVFTLCPDEGDRQRFIDLLTGVAELTDARLAVVTTMRADFLEPCLRYPALHQLIQSQTVFMPPLSGIDLRDAIVEPAQRQGYGIEEGLLLKILEDVGKEPGFLPLLEFALTKLWEQRDTERKQLTLEQYENLGEMTGGLNLHAEKVYLYRDFEREAPIEQRSKSEQEWIKRVFLRLVRTGEAEKDTRQRRSKTDLLTFADNTSNAQDKLDELLEDLLRGRLLVAGNGAGEDWVDLAHEALIQGWERYVEWRSQDRDLRRLSDRLEDALREWQKYPTDRNLMMGGLLAQVLEKWQDLEPGLDTATREFYHRSYIYEQEQITRLEKLRSEVRQRTREAEQAEKASLLKSERLAIVAHELRTPLNGTIGFLKMIIDGMVDDLEEQSQFVQEAYRLAIHLLNLINDILDVAKIEVGEMQLDLKPIKLDDLLADVENLTRLQAQQKALSFKILTPAMQDEVIICGNYQRLLQVMLNLVGNAIKFTHEGGITISTEVIPGKVIMQGEERPGTVRISVADTGIGISLEKQEKLFQTFRRVDGSRILQYGGTGLGLAVSQKLIEAMGGSFHFLSMGEGLGSTVSFTVGLSI